MADSVERPAPVTESALRERAEATIRERTDAPSVFEAPRTPEATERLLHELRVHRIELELQNEELRRAHLELDDARAR